jgi:hypothetical protein
MSNSAFDPTTFILPKYRTIPLFEKLEVGSPAEFIVHRFGSWKLVPNTHSVYWCGDDTIQFTLMLNSDGVPYEVAVYRFYDDIGEFRRSRHVWGSDCTYVTLAENESPVSVIARECGLDSSTFA